MLNATKYESNFLDTKIEDILNFNSKDLTYQIVRDKLEINDIKSSEIVGSISEEIFI